MLDGLVSLNVHDRLIWFLSCAFFITLDARKFKISFLKFMCAVLDQVFIVANTMLLHVCLPSCVYWTNGVMFAW